MTLHPIQNVYYPKQQMNNRAAVKEKHRAVIYEAATMLLESDLVLPKQYQISVNTKRELKRIIWGIGENKLDNDVRLPEFL
tara:strand:+ start:439 stop:681 length:243 start_codon:yes stop_codon:yes gene_type:complete